MKEGRASAHTYLLDNHYGPMGVQKCLPTIANFLESSKLPPKKTQNEFRSSILLEIWPLLWSSAHDILSLSSTPSGSGYYSACLLLCL